jgi:hypothetical protein
MLVDENGQKLQNAQRFALTYHKFSLTSALSFFFDGVKPFIEVSIAVAC